MATYNLFISHSWAYSGAYEKLIALLDKKPYFSYKDYSVPKDDPIHTRGSDTELYSAIQRKIQLTQVVVIMAGVYSSYSKWINNEIEIAQSAFQQPVPILAIEPWASKRASQTVKDAANKVVGWNTDTIVKGIRELVP